jgi:hypothetical protein
MSFEDYLNEIKQDIYDKSRYSLITITEFNKVMEAIKLLKEYGDKLFK